MGPLLKIYQIKTPPYFSTQAFIEIRIISIFRIICRNLGTIWKDTEGIVRMNELAPPVRMTLVYLTEYTFFSTLCGKK